MSNNEFRTSLFDIQHSVFDIILDASRSGQSNFIAMGLKPVTMSEKFFAALRPTARPGVHAWMSAFVSVEAYKRYCAARGRPARRIKNIANKTGITPLSKRNII